MLEDKLYRRGFLCTPADDDDRPLGYLARWNLQRGGAWILRSHPETPVRTQTGRGGCVIVVFGDIFVAHGTATLEECLDRIGAGDLTPLDDLSGRFAILVVAGSELRVVQDPIGSQTVFYSTRHHAVGSHAALLAEYFDVPRSRAVRAFMAMPEQKAKTTRFLPGDLSVFDGIHLLIPNNELSVESGRTRRYWPHSPVPTSTPDDVFGVWDEFFDNYAAYLRQNHQVVMGLTGGVDSRGMIATLRAKGVEMRYETWDAMKPAERGRIPTMAEYLGGEHRWIDLKHREDDQGFREYVESGKRAAGYTRGTPNLPALVAQDAEPSDVFIYGHGGGVTAGAYGRKAKNWLPEDALDRAYYVYAGPMRKEASPEYRQFSRRAFREFLDRGNYDSDLHEVDVGDLLYWEHRMANWASLQIAVHAAGVNAHAGLNSRRIYGAFWGLPEARHEKTLNAELIGRYDPMLAAL